MNLCVVVVETTVEKLLALMKSKLGGSQDSIWPCQFTPAGRRGGEQQYTTETEEVVSECWFDILIL